MCMFTDKETQEYEREYSDLAETLSVRIFRQLSYHNWTLKMLSDKSDVPYETLKKIANGKIENPSLRSILKIAAAFGCSIDFLAGLTESDEILQKKRRLEMHSYLNSL